MASERYRSLSDSLSESPARRIGMLASLATIIGLTSEIANELSGKTPDFPALSDQQLTEIVSLGGVARENCENTKDGGKTKLSQWVDSTRPAVFDRMGLSDQSYHWCKGPDGEGRLTNNYVAFSDGVFASTWEFVSDTAAEEGRRACFESHAPFMPQTSYCEEYYPDMGTVALDTRTGVEHGLEK